MGFKRTSEGRVFFQNMDQNGVSRDNQDNTGKQNQNLRAENSGVSNRIAQHKQDSTQIQIIALLKSLNEKLQSTQADRKKLQQELETHRIMVMKLQEKTAQQEKETRQIRTELSQKDSVSVQKLNDAERLSKEALKEFEEARRLIAEIEERSERTESLVKKQQMQVRQAEEQARVKWDDLKKKSRKEIENLMLRVNNAEESQKHLDQRIEETANNTLKLDRKVDKAIQDRSRFIRKLERIEETVLQTHEAMNARAMVLLTDQGTAENSGYHHKPALDGPDQPRAEKSDEELYFDVPWWRKPMRMQAVSVSMLVVAATLLGWGISEMQKPSGFSSFVPDNALQGWNSASNDVAEPNFVNIEDAGTARVDAIPAERAMQRAENEMASIQSEALLEAGENPAVSEFDRIMAEQALDIEKNDDIGAIDLSDEDQLVALLEDNPDAVATELNKIEPSSIPEKIETVQELPKKREAIVELNEKVDLPSVLEGTIYDRIKADKTLPEAVKSIEDAAFSGNAEAQHDLAAIYIAGHGGVQQDYSRASLWFEEAAHNGIANARYNLGVLYHQGIGVDKDIEAAFEWYKAAAFLGHPEAQYNLGIAYIEGIGVPYDPIKAAAYFESSANSGVMEAAYNIGLIFENGLLGKAEPDTALMWYKRAADQGSPEAKAALNQLAKTLGMSIADVNKLIEGMEVLQEKPAQKKTDKLTSLKKEEKNINVGSPEPLNIVSLVQEELMNLGLYPGPVDGVEGALTKDAVKTYQSRNNLSVDGEIDEALLKHMQFDTLGDTEGRLEQGSRER